MIDSFRIVGAGANVAGGGPGGTFLGVSHTEGGHLVKLERKGWREGKISITEGEV